MALAHRRGPGGDREQAAAAEEHVDLRAQREPGAREDGREQAVEEASDGGAGASGPGSRGGGSVVAPGRRQRRRVVAHKARRTAPRPPPPAVTGSISPTRPASALASVLASPAARASPCASARAMRRRVTASAARERARGDVGVGELAQDAGGLGAQLGGGLEVGDGLGRAVEARPELAAREEGLDEAGHVVDPHGEGALGLGRVAAGGLEVAEREVRGAVGGVEGDGVEVGPHGRVRLALRRVVAAEPGALDGLRGGPAHRGRLRVVRVRSGRGEEQGGEQGERGEGGAGGARGDRSDRGRGRNRREAARSEAGRGEGATVRRGRHVKCGAGGRGRGGREGA